MMPESQSHLWTIVLAAGDGTRLRPLTRALHGEDLPKQFAVITGKRSLLQNAVARAARWSAPERIVVVVARERDSLARAQLRRFPGVRIAAQPRNVGTGPGIMLPLAVIRAEDPDAQVVILPSDQYVRDDASFEGSVQRADTAAPASSSVVLIGAVPDKAEDQYGWIIPQVDDETGRLVVSAFREKPNASVAEELRRAGALWSTFVMVGGARRLWGLAERRLPAQSALFERYERAIRPGRGPTVLSEIYSEMAPADFSRTVLEGAGDLEVVALPACGWSDSGTPERVFDSLRGSADFDTLVGRLRQSRIADRAPPERVRTDRLSSARIRATTARASVGSAFSRVPRGGPV